MNIFLYTDRLVLKDNPAKRAYLTLGGKKIDEELIRIGEQELFEDCYAWNDVSFLID
ncbi:hypothetical protein [Fictibacillus phosphorivorans]|uniref:hypothetical protein n=1 Tax=Fictibacillus phosphorivorans TaxID=1221500 RepID=UPI00203D5D43|nr:hypothetical protein [Fictibacillus phosphorivorans]MCM3718216.1 hypothetical protein [Fictibacillus phosphorivorans]MCM3775917.1 hypothetical protein [Fictibacillus phosphorivorans]